MRSGLFLAACMTLWGVARADVLTPEAKWRKIVSTQLTGFGDVSDLKMLCTCTESDGIHASARQIGIAEWTPDSDVLGRWLRVKCNVPHFNPAGSMVDFVACSEFTLMKK